MNAPQSVTTEEDVPALRFNIALPPSWQSVPSELTEALADTDKRLTADHAPFFRTNRARSSPYTPAFHWMRIELVSTMRLTTSTNTYPGVGDTVLVDVTVTLGVELKEALEVADEETLEYDEILVEAEIDGVSVGLDDTDALVEVLDVSDKVSE